MSDLAPRTLDTKRYRWRKANGIELYTDVVPVVEHVMELHAIGVTPQMIGYVAECSRQVIQNLPLHAQITVTLAARILAVTHLPHPRQHRVLAIGATRRIQALQALGWTRWDIAERLEIDSSTISQICNAQRVTYGRWAAVRALYEELSGTPGPSQRAAATARKHGLAAPLAWEGLDIDDPRVQPDWAATGIRLADRPVCLNGHRYTPANTRRDSRGHRRCKTCDRASDRRNLADRRGRLRSA
ncbi:hypothetical protein [Nocardia thailandica]|uniref:hypothetical protein n=1 Tax=Nocardia thailandica TaxID=257275 RepID=UPI0002D8FCFE|nr:hypothetical protein [Nocardia thailandica]